MRFWFISILDSSSPDGINWIWRHSLKIIDVNVLFINQRREKVGHLSPHRFIIIIIDLLLLKTYRFTARVLLTKI